MSGIETGVQFLGLDWRQEFLLYQHVEEIDGLAVGLGLDHLLVKPLHLGGRCSVPRDGQVRGTFLGFWMHRQTPKCRVTISATIESLSGQESASVAGTAHRVQRTPAPDRSHRKGTPQERTYDLAARLRRGIDASAGVRSMIAVHPSSRASICI